MKLLQNTEVYQCSYCKRLSLSKSGITIHEKACRNNPENMTLCSMCANCERTEGVGEHPKYNKVTDFTCLASGEKMHSPKVLRMQECRRKQIISRCPKLMPTQKVGCKHFEILRDI